MNIEEKKLKEAVERRCSERKEIKDLKARIEDLENRIKAMEDTGLVMNPTPEYHPF